MPFQNIDYGECLKDSPSFRQQLLQNESSLDELEVKLEKLVKSCGGVVESGKAHIGQQAQMIASLWELSSYYASEQETETNNDLNKMIHVLQENLKYQNLLIDQANRCVSKNLTGFLNKDFKQMKETRGYFNKISNDLDSALSKNAAVSKSRPSDLEDSSNLLTATKSAFRYTGLDYVYQITVLQQKKKQLVLDSISSYMGAFQTLFRHGTDLMVEHDPFLKTIQSNLVLMSEKTSSLEKQLEKRHTYVTQGENLDTAQQDLSVTTAKGKPVRIEGYLFKRGQKAFRTWNRRWFFLSSNKLCYSKRNGEDVTILEDDLRICLVRPLLDSDRRFCFEIISPVKSHVLQADSDTQYKLWLSTLQQGISSALHDEMARDSEEEPQWEDSDTEQDQDGKARLVSNPGRKVRSAEQILVIPGNEVCGDCGALGPQWASINWGVVLCIECGGIHRSLGVHITKVRGIMLDVWDPEILKVMAELGNSIVNSILEAKVGDRVKPTEQDTRATKEKWIKDKYQEKLFVNRDVFQSEEIKDADGWTVKRLRRRMRGGKSRRTDQEKDTEKEALDKDEKDIDTSNDDTEDSSLLESVLKASTLSGTSSSAWIGSPPALEKIINAEVCLFGGSLGKHHVASVELDSDQESTDGEEEGAGGQAWVSPSDPLSLLNPDMLLFRAARAHNLPVMLQAIALGANPQWKHEEESDRTSVHQSILSGSVMATEFLILNSVSMTAEDRGGDTALHLAAGLGNTGQVCLLLKHKSDHHKRNKQGMEPLDIAVSRADADIVTLLRLAALNEEIRENDMTGGDDDTFNDVVQEFSQMVYTHPERLQKKMDRTK